MRYSTAAMSPGSVTEKLFFFVAEYQPGDRVAAGGGTAADGEDIEVLEIGIDEALGMIATGAIRDGKTIMLLQYAALHLLPRCAACHRCMILGSAHGQRALWYENTTPPNP
jgi:hypothetical protein